ncbi:MAG: DUF5655 domain-containing protein [Halobacteriales archaeon]|nr:DUF5655 domain-containing protein [Halobacteriales archaeon]
MAWTCPACQRSFAHEGQSHSCRKGPTLDQHFGGKPPQLRKAFDRIVQELEDSGEVRVDPVAANIHLVAGSAFASAAPRKSGLRVEFLLDHEVRSKRIVRLEKLSATRLAHHVDVAGPEDVDHELLRWLRAAQRLRA